MPTIDPTIGHLLRRAGFGASTEDAAFWNQMGPSAAIDRLVDYEVVPDDVDERIGTLGSLGTTSRGPFRPDTFLPDARQRWLFRMVHTERPLQEKMVLFWHNLFATGFGKIAGQIGPPAATQALAAKPSINPNGVRGQLELFREQALGNFADLLLSVSQDPAMVAWLDGDTNFKEKPQENYARELMELFTVGVDFHTESDVQAGARVFTGWNLRRRNRGRDDPYAEFFFNRTQHDTDAKTFSFPIYPNGDHTIPARTAAAGLQDGRDLINALAAHPATGPRLARRLYAFFVNELDPPDEALVQLLSSTFYASGFNMREVVRQLLKSSAFLDPANRWTRYAWPVEFVARLIREVGWTGFSAAAALTPLSNMGQTLFEPPDVSGWSLGPAWFSTGTMLSRMNFAASLAENQRFAIGSASLSSGESPAALLAYMLDRLSRQPLEPSTHGALLDYASAGEPWTGSSAQIISKSSGLVHLVGGSSEYQFI